MKKQGSRQAITALVILLLGTSMGRDGGAITETPEWPRSLAQQDRPPQRIEKPRYKEPESGIQYRIDWCFQAGKECGKVAADYYCQKSEHFDEAWRWEKEEGVGKTEPTWILGDEIVCDKSWCDGFKYITCRKTPRHPGWM